MNDLAAKQNSSDVNNGQTLQTDASAAMSPHPPAETHTQASPRVKLSRRKKWLFIIIAVIVVVGGTVSGWYWLHRNISPPVLTHISVRLNWVNNPQFAGMYVAKDKGYYKAAGLDVDLKEFQDNVDVNKEVASGAVDYGVSTPLEILLARDKGQLNKAIAAIYQTSAFSIVARKQANVTTPSDLKGKILGAAGGNNEAAITYAALLSKAGINRNQTTIKPVNLDIVTVFKESQADTYDVYRTDQTFLLDKAHIPYTQIFPEQYGFSIYGDVLIASDTKIAKNKDETRAFVKATLEGWQYTLDHESEALSILARHVNVLYKDPAYIKYDLTNTLPLIRPTGGQPLGSMNYVPWNRAYIAAKDSGLLHGHINPTSLYTSEFRE